MIDGILERLVGELGPENEVNRDGRPGPYDRQGRRDSRRSMTKILRWMACARDLGKNPFVLTENYFNYFTEIEDHFRKGRGTGLFSTLASGLGAD